MILLGSINLILRLEEPKVATNWITQLPTFEPSAPTINNNYDVLQSAYHIVMPISPEFQIHCLRTWPAITRNKLDSELTPKMNMNRLTLGRGQGISYVLSSPS